MQSGEVNSPYRSYAYSGTDIDASFTPSEHSNLPRLALQTLLNPEFENIGWYGRGPMENYQDRKNAANVGLYKRC